MVARADRLTYEELSAIRERSYRNGNWRRLTQAERALYRASLGLARLRGKVVNAHLLEVLRGIIGKLTRRLADKILEIGRKRASELRELYRRNGVFGWLPMLERLLEDEDYLFWLGNRELLMRSIGFN